MPNRILKESICYSDDIDKLKSFTETFYYRLIVNCDDFGRFDARERVLKSTLFPLKDGVTLKNIKDSLTELASVGLVVLYEVDGKPFLFLPTWEKHQTRRAKFSKWPSPESSCIQLQAGSSICPRGIEERGIEERGIENTSEQGPDQTKFEDNSAQMKLAMLLFEKIRKNDPKAKEPDFQKWSVHVDRLIRIDKRTPKEIQDVIVWCQKDDFWKSNILSTEKLRKQFGQLVVKAGQTAATNRDASYDVSELERMVRERQGVNRG